MDKKLLVVVFFIILSTQEIEAVIRTCKSRSREFGGRCIRLTQRNCNIVCMHEEFQYGVCRMGRCYCAKSCGGGGPVVKPPAVKPPPAAKTPPAVENPPENESPPESGPPADQDGGQ
ncbi:hypothetical protein ABFS83_10G127500 [Erythranthe nasuta]